MRSVIISSGCRKDPKLTDALEVTMFTDTNVFTLSVPETKRYLRDIQRNSIGMDEWFRRFETAHESQANYPPFNLVKETATKFRLEIALAGYGKEDIEVTTEWNKLHVESKKVEESDVEYVHRGVAKRAFNRSWTLSDDVVVGDVTFENGMLTIELNRVVPEHQMRKVYDIA